MVLFPTSAIPSFNVLDAATELVFNDMSIILSIRRFVFLSFCSKKSKCSAKVVNVQSGLQNHSGNI